MEAIGALLPNTISVTVPPIVSLLFSFIRSRVLMSFQTDGGVFVRSLPPGGARNAALDKVSLVSVFHGRRHEIYCGYLTVQSHWHDRDPGGPALRGRNLESQFT